MKKWVTLSITLRTVTVKGRAYTVEHVLRRNPAHSFVFLFSHVTGFGNTTIKAKLPRYYELRDVAEAIAKAHLIIKKEIAKVLKKSSDK